MCKILLYSQVKDSLLLAIDEEYVEGVELLLQHEERTHNPGKLRSGKQTVIFFNREMNVVTPLVAATTEKDSWLGRRHA